MEARESVEQVLLLLLMVLVAVLPWVVVVRDLPAVQVRLARSRAWRTTREIRRREGCGGRR